MIEGVSIIVNGEHHRLPKPFRHHHLLEMLDDEGWQTPIVGEQGFYVDDGSFINRIDGAVHAIECGQIKELKFGKKLFSEDLW